MANQQLAVFDPSGRLIVELGPLAAAAGVTLHAIKPGEPTGAYAAILVAPPAANDLGPAPAAGPPRWIVGDAANAAELAVAASRARASGVLFMPVSSEAIAAIAHVEPAVSEDDLALDLVRARSLIATSLVDLTGSVAETLLAVAGWFGANDCIVWSMDDGQVAPTTARPYPTERYRAEIASAARVGAAAGTVITSGRAPRSVMADALRASPGEVNGLVAIVADTARRFSAAERSDLEALALRLTRELSWLSPHRRLIADGERSLATSLHDPLTNAISRSAFEQLIAHEAVIATRRGSALALAVLDIIGMHQINVAHGHRAGDEVLAQVTTRVRAMLRGNDPIGRLGGDELAVLVTDATAEQGAAVVRTLIEEVQSDPIAVDATTELHVRMRATVTELVAGELDGEVALARCYAALRAASAGEVRVVAADERVTEGDPEADTGGLSIGTIVGGTYRVVHELSRGAMGVVYRGEDLGLARPVAIKILRSDLAPDRELVSRFRAEAGLLASLHHPNLVQVYALGEHAGDVYFVMELVEGQPLSEVVRATLQRNEWFPTAAAAQIALEIGDALDAMHEVGVIHRDVKPANILLDRERDRAVLVDVGVAVKAGDPRDAAGTPGFAAPESFLDHADAPTTDVYGLAATVYCMLTGRAPFGAGSASQVMQRQLGERLPPPSELRPSLSEAVDAVLIKALLPVPKKRWASASTFAIALARALERLPGNPAQVARSIEDSIEDPISAAEVLLGPTEGLDSIELQKAASKRVAIGHVRAAHLRVLSRLLQHYLGEAGLAQLVHDTPALAGVLSATLAPLGWVALADLVTAFELARTHVPSQLMPYKVGRGTMSATFARLFGADPAALSAETVLTALPAFWARYHDWGDIEVSVRPGSADLVLYGYAGSLDVCALVAAELERVVELTGASVVGVTHTACALTGAKRCEYRVTWTQ